MKKSLPGGLQILMLIIALFFSGFSLPQQALAQIYEPEGLNLPGNWDGWSNPPANLALASSTQVTGGRVTKIAVGQARWQTIFSVGATGADLVGGSYNWLFTSGPSSNYYQNKWAGTAVTMNTLQTYVNNGAGDNQATLTNGRWYTMNWEDLGYVDCKAIFMETSAAPVTLSSVSVPATVNENTPVVITITTAQAKSAEEIIYLRYSTDGWATSAAVVASMTGTSGTATIPGQAAGTTVSYYAFSSTVAGLTENYDLCTIKLNNNENLNYTYTVATDLVISFANLQFPGSGSIETGQAFSVYGQAYIEGVTGQATPAPGLQAWIGYSTTNTGPSTWTNWIAATHNGPAGNNDEFVADLGAAITTAGSYYYATRFRLDTDPYVYGGYTATGGGFWDGTINISGTLTVTDPIPDPDFDWVNLQFPGSATITVGDGLDVFAQDYIEGVTGQSTPAPGVMAWIGYSTGNTNPNTWTNWLPATFNGPSGNNDEYKADLGQAITAEGTYYYASRFRLNTGAYYFGGFSETGGGLWNGSTNISGLLTVEALPPDPVITFANLQFPGSGTIETGQAFSVYGQAYIEGITGQATPAPGLLAWVGYSTTNNDPATWTSWIAATHNGPSGNNDEFMADLGAEITTAGIYYYATRFKYNDDAYVYGGFSATNGGFWDGTLNVSGNLVVTNPIPDPDFDWVNLQFPGSATITVGDGLDVYAQDYIEGVTGQSTPAPGVAAWIGYSTGNTNPATWTNWLPATFNGPSGNNDEYKADLGQAITTEGTYYYASRFRLNTGEYYFGGFSETGGGLWNGNTNISGVLTVEALPPDPIITFANLQFPGNGTIETGQAYSVYGQAYIEGITGQATPAPGLLAWVGYSTSNTDPATWTNWIAATHNGPAGNNDEFMADLGAEITAAGTYYYATRFKYNDDAYVYGGFSAINGGFWDGTLNVSGQLTVTDPIVDPDFDWVNLQFPGSAGILIGESLDVYAQDYIEGVTGQGTPAPGVECWIGYSSSNSNPATWTNWLPATYNAASGNNDEYKADLGLALTSGGIYYYASRFRLNTGDYYYGGFSETGGGFWNGNTNVSGVVTVTDPQQTFPVLFTIIDATQQHTNIKLKGEMTDWATVAMINNNHTWTLTLDMHPGTYQWGAIEDDGSANGIWLIDGGNLVMTLGADGTISGTVTYTTLIISVNELPIGARIYPNPASDLLYLEVPGIESYRLYDLSGRLVKAGTITENQPLSLSDLSAGMFRLQMMVGEKRYFGKIVKR